LREYWGCIKGVWPDTHSPPPRVLRYFQHCSVLLWLLQLNWQ
jgi:hypothetical protein